VSQVLVGQVGTGERFDGSRDIDISLEEGEGFVVDAVVDGERGVTFDTVVPGTAKRKKEKGCYVRCVAKTKSSRYERWKSNELLTGGFVCAVIKKRADDETRHCVEFNVVNKEKTDKVRQILQMIW
jgi:hypothetical protein